MDNFLYLPDRFQDRFDQLMGENDISNYKLSQEIGVPDSAVGYWRKGTRAPSAENLIKIADYFQVSTDYLLCRIEKPYLSDFAELDQLERDALEALRPLTDDQKHLIVELMKTMKKPI